MPVVQPQPFHTAWLRSLGLFHLNSGFWCITWQPERVCWSLFLDALMCLGGTDGWAKCCALSRSMPPIHMYRIGLRLADVEASASSELGYFICRRKI